MIAYSEALQHLLDAATPLPAEHLPLHEAGGRTLASDIHSGQSLPPFDNSAMDGFALRANGATFEAGTEFAVQGWQAAGDAGAEGGEGTWEIMTGARMPVGLDTVVPVENVEILASEEGRPTRIALKGTARTYACVAKTLATASACCRPGRCWTSTRAPCCMPSAWLRWR